MEMSDIKKAIEGIKSVESCGIITDERNFIEEIHIVADFSRNPKQISRDVQAVLISRFDIDIDHKKISIAQLKDVDIEKDEQCRLILKTIEYSVTGSKSEVRVILEKDGIPYDAAITGTNTRFNIQRLLSSATLKAVEIFLGKEDLFSFEDVRVLTVSDAEVVVVTVVVMENNQEKKLFGCSSTKKDFKEAVVRATLNAINRKVAMYMNK